MSIIKKNKGFSILNLILIIALIGTVGILGFQIGVGYINQNSIKSAVKSALMEAKQSENTPTTKSIEDNIGKKLSVGTIELANDDISVSKVDGGFEVDVTYIKQVQMTERIKLVVNLSFKERTIN